MTVFLNYIFQYLIFYNFFLYLIFLLRTVNLCRLNLQVLPFFLISSFFISILFCLYLSSLCPMDVIPFCVPFYFTYISVIFKTLFTELFWLLISYPLLLPHAFLNTLLLFYYLFQSRVGHSIFLHWWWNVWFTLLFTFGHYFFGSYLFPIFLIISFCLSCACFSLLPLLKEVNLFRVRYFQWALVTVESWEPFSGRVGTFHKALVFVCESLW